MTYPIYQIDAFSAELFKGNPAAVCPLNAWLPDAQMQAIAQENNLAETAFFIKNDDGFHIRWFTPVVEVDLCGHATLASAFLIFEHLGHPSGIIEFKSRSGLLKVKKNGTWLTLDFPSDKLEKVETPPKITQSLNIQPQACFKGKDDYMVVVDTQKLIEELNPDFRIIASLESRGLIVTAPGEETDFVSRCFFPQTGIDEDPVTGSAHTTLTPYWAKRLGRNELTARQLSKRGGFLKCKYLGERVEISGQAKLYLKGEIFI